MNKADLVEFVHTRLVSSSNDPVTKKAATDAVEAVIDGMEQGIKAGDGVQLVGFGSFTTGKRAARKGRNPATGAEIDIPAATVIKFHAGKALKDAVNPAPAAKGKKK